MNRRLLGIAIAAASSLASAAAGQQAPPPTAPIADPRDVVAFEQDESDRMTVPVSIGGRGPYRFIVDTGSERTVISQELASRLDLHAGSEATLHSISGSGEVSTVIIPRLRVSKRTVRGIHAPALSAADIGAVGMLGIDSLKTQRVLFDFDRRTMAITPSIQYERDWGPNTIVVKARTRYGRLVLSDARIDGEKVLVILDTGSQVTIGNGALRRKLVARNKLQPTRPIELLSVTGGLAPADYTKVRHVRLGGIHIRDLPIAFADIHPFRQLGLHGRPALLLGMDALKLFDRVSVDFAHQRVQFLAPDIGLIEEETRLAQLMSAPRVAAR
ncbi:MAG TPA: retropepsin-like aspartic protease [Allosphingosinicella sp.]|nr:retropepsin-like aspartic protease [Allosphingosinicella sp.]